MFTALLLMAAVPQTPGDQARADLRTWLDSYESCLRNGTVKAGAFNREPATTVIAAARAGCATEWQQVRKAWLGETWETVADRRHLDDFRRDCEDRATADLLAARSGPGIKHRG